MGRGGRFRDLVAGDALGLNDRERLAILERAVLGDVGVEQQVEILRRRLEAAESAVRRLQMPWWMRWLWFRSTERREPR